MGRHCYVLLRRCHDVPIICRGELPLRRFAEVPRGCRRVFHLRRNCDVTGTYRKMQLRRRYYVLLPSGIPVFVYIVCTLSIVIVLNIFVFSCCYKFFVMKRFSLTSPSDI